MKFGVSEHNTSEYKKRIAELLEQQSNTNLTSESSSPRHTVTEPLETNKCNPSADYAEKLSPRSELYKIHVKFSGQDKSFYLAFQRHIRIALAQNADRYVTLQSQISLIYQNLGLEPQSFLDQYLGEDGLFTLKSVQDVWNTLDVSYRNPNEEEEARAVLAALRQKDRSYGAYLAEFQKYRNMSGITDEGTLI